MRNLMLVQANYQYGDNVFLPYSVGRLWAYAKQFPEITDHYDILPLVFLRTDPERLLEWYPEPDVIGLSCYIWNWEYNLEVIRTFKAKYPHCLIVLGGPHVPQDLKNLDESFISHGVDLLVYSEGEKPFADILRKRAANSTSYEKYELIENVIDLEHTVLTGMPGGNIARNTNLSDLPSPYLTGVFDSIMTQPFKFQASQETHRGCPYSCTFCDWGSAVYQKVKPFPLETILDEITWFGENKIELVYNCDANYGILKESIQITEALVEAKARYGYPQKFRAAYAKKQTPTVFNVAKMLNDSGMSKGVTISLQSLDKDCLVDIKRKNIEIDDLATVLDMYRNEGIPTYSELILGLPGETSISFRQGIDKLLNAGQHDGINVYLCMVLPNSELNDVQYRSTHQIEAHRSEMMLLHASPSYGDSIIEYYRIINSTKDMNWKAMMQNYQLATVIQAYHCFPMLRYIAQTIVKSGIFTYTEFYKSFIDFLVHKNMSTTNLISWLDEQIMILINDGRTKDSLDLTIPEYGDIQWPLEEALFLRTMLNKDQFYKDVEFFLKSTFEDDYEDHMLEQLVSYQKALLISPYSHESSTVREFDYNFFDFINKGASLQKTKHALWIKYEDAYMGDLEKYGREIAWYGRKGGKYGIEKVSVI